MLVLSSSLDIRPVDACKSTTVRVEGPAASGASEMGLVALIAIIAFWMDKDARRMKHEISSPRSEVSTPPAFAHPHYRPDIDGLRAVAVLAVVGFHAFPQSIGGGLIGVDIFFVISGFLISSIIFQGLRSDRFSYLDFYIRRIKRIFPALILVLLVCLIVGWFALYDVEYKPLGLHVAGGAAFISNFLLSKESGYFDSASEFKELLHLWSLGIEEQFYLIFPLLMALCWKQTRTLLPLVIALLVVSFALNAWLIYKDPAATFYMPFTRFWELMIGAALAHISQTQRSVGATRFPVLGGRILSEACAWIGAALVLTALCFIDKDSAFPGWLALLPTVGAFLLIAAGPVASVNRYVLASRPLVFVGLISYPLYLWHWPILSFERIIKSDAPGRVSRALAVLLSVLLAWLTYCFIEKPVRSNRKPALAVALCIVLAMIGCAGLLVEKNAGFANRSINARNEEGRKLLRDSVESDAQIRNELYKTRNCEFLGSGMGSDKSCATYGAADAETIVVWGDSHANAWSPVFFKIGQEHHLRVVRLYIGGCPPLVETRRIDPAFASAPCAVFGQAERMIDIIRSVRPTRIFMIARWNLYTSGKVAVAHPDDHEGSAVRSNLVETQLRKTLQALPLDIPVTVFRTAPVLNVDPERALLRHVKAEMPVQEYLRQNAVFNQSIDAAVAVRQNAGVFDPAPTLCAQSCTEVAHGTVMYANATHLSARGALTAFDALSSAYFAPVSPPPAHVNGAQLIQ